LRYGYVCQQHGPLTTDFRADAIYCPHGETVHEANRDWTFHLDYSFEPYFAPSFGTVVRSRTHAKDLAKIASEEATRRLGFDHDYQVVDTHDDEAVGVDTEAKKAQMENTRRFAVNGAAWSKERLREINEAKAKVTAERADA
jgi:hypothetical protein